MKVLIAIVLVAGLFLLNVFLFRKNKHTPVPKGCENLTPDCGSCGMSDCTSRMKPIRKEEDDGNH
ncbi:MAG: hypothetical protein LKF53_04225 [Solobacterium sp.]|jgi:hypothetical protein|nr:hypothetical protein [Solobacterium sp.]MCH4205581.1 hypothetical protein [Solobacterium sp.]MCH4227084.1 hypothetical protein [Solobacterium sp.]MCH4282344.1 hypothetical protein [Solobacterium sp.]